jgi:hypothetical protein
MTQFAYRDYIGAALFVFICAKLIVRHSDTIISWLEQSASLIMR